MLKREIGELLRDRETGQSWSEWRALARVKAQLRRFDARRGRWS